MTQLETFVVPLLSLPPSFHREVMKNSAQWLDVYRIPRTRSCLSTTYGCGRLPYFRNVTYLNHLIHFPLFPHLSGMYPFAVYSKVVSSIFQSTICPIRLCLYLVNSMYYFVKAEEMLGISFLQCKYAPSRQRKETSPEGYIYHAHKFSLVLNTYTFCGVISHHLRMHKTAISK
jgi:hypothetical protein